MKENKRRFRIFSSTLTLLCLIFLFSNLFAERRDSWLLPEKVMSVIGVKREMVIGVAGAGHGYFTFKMAKRVGPNGRIYANEINKNKLEYIKNRCKRDNVINVTTILGEVEDPLFPIGKMDMVFMCYVFHDLKKPVEFLINIKKSLKPQATVVILDQDPGKTGSTHFYKKEILLKKIEAANYKVLRIETFLSKDNIYICRPKK